MSNEFDNPESRSEEYLAAIAGMTGLDLQPPLSRIEKSLAYIAEHGGGSDARVDEIIEKIPSAASSSNQLADKAYVNQQIAAAIADVDDLLGSGVIN